ncbi:hypothetical protein ACHJH3_06570 [Campylobacter sp. MOP7]|uniref:hypothetical protein n=1 Tax=Campylobacter canis TaxID=3378588 RepID=UPI00387EA1ED
MSYVKTEISKDKFDDLADRLRAEADSCICNLLAQSKSFEMFYSEMHNSGFEPKAVFPFLVLLCGDDEDDWVKAEGYVWSGNHKGKDNQLFIGLYACRNPERLHFAIERICDLLGVNKDDIWFKEVRKPLRVRSFVDIEIPFGLRGLVLRTLWCKGDI